VGGFLQIAGAAGGGRGRGPPVGPGGPVGWREGQGGGGVLSRPPPSARGVDPGGIMSRTGRTPRLFRGAGAAPGCTGRAPGCTGSPVARRAGPGREDPEQGLAQRPGPPPVSRPKERGPGLGRPAKTRPSSGPREHHILREREPVTWACPQKGNRSTHQGGPCIAPAKHRRGIGTPTGRKNRRHCAVAVERRDTRTATFRANRGATRGPRLAPPARPAPGIGIFFYIDAYFLANRSPIAPLNISRGPFSRLAGVGGPSVDPRPPPRRVHGWTQYAALPAVLLRIRATLPAAPPTGPASPPGCRASPSHA